MTQIDTGVDFTIFEAEELDNDETIYVELTRDLESDRHVRISATCKISSVQFLVFSLKYYSQYQLAIFN